MASKGKRRNRYGDEPVPLHKPNRILKHVADEYEDMGNTRIAAELRRHQRGHVGRFVELALSEKGDA